MKDTSNQIFRLLPAVRNIYKNAHRRRPVCVVPVMAIHLSYDIEPENKSDARVLFYINVSALAEGKIVLKGVVSSNEISNRKQRYPYQYACA